MLASRFLVLGGVSVLGTLFACAPSGDEPGDEQAGALSDSERSCVIEQPIADDGYRDLLEADPSKVTRKKLGARGLEDDAEKVVRPTDAQIKSTMRRINAYVDRVDREVGGDIRRREGYSGAHRGETPASYCLFHAAGKAVYGTVVLFHGFNDRPHQQSKLASYLFHSGFDVYNVFLANHMMVPGTNFWPKTVYNQSIGNSIKAKLAAPENQGIFKPAFDHIRAGNAGAGDYAAIDRVLGPDVTTSMLKDAWSDPGGDTFQRLYASHVPDQNQSLPDAARQADFMQYVRDAQSRIADLADMPGPVFVSGLSVGGALSLAAAAADGGKRVRAVVSHAPWLQSLDEKNNAQIRMVAALDDAVSALGGEYPMVWDSHKIPFSPASVGANLALGAWTARPDNVKVLATIPTAQVITEDEDSADNEVTGKLHSALTQNPAVASLHVRVAYSKDLHIRHAITDPENYPDEVRWNRFYRSLYQESFRFYTTGTMSQSNLVSRQPDPTLPQPTCVMKDYPHRCNQ